MFRDREDAGRSLALALAKYRDREVLVLAIPRGGVEIAYHVAIHLNADLSVLIARKFPYPDNPEAGFGALAEDGSAVLSDEARFSLTDEEIEAIIRAQRTEMERRVRVLRKGRPLPPLAGRTVILIDDGLAMGSTMKAAIALCRRAKAGRIVVAVPVAGDRAVREIQRLADEVIVLERPEPFYAVAQAYENWHDVPDEEALAHLDRWEQDRTRERPA